MHISNHYVDKNSKITKELKINPFQTLVYSCNLIESLVSV